MLLVGIESNDQLYVPWGAEVQNPLCYTKRDRQSTCESRDRFGRPLGGDWVVSVYAVCDRSVYDAITTPRVMAWLCCFFVFGPQQKTRVGCFHSVTT